MASYSKSVCICVEDTILWQEMINAIMKMNNTLHWDDYLKWKAFTYILLYVFACAEVHMIKEIFSVFFLMTESSLDIISSEAFKIWVFSSIDSLWGENIIWNQIRMNTQIPFFNNLFGQNATRLSQARLQQKRDVKCPVLLGFTMCWWSQHILWFI